MGFILGQDFTLVHKRDTVAPTGFIHKVGRDEDGDFVIDDSDNQHQKDILVAYKGEYKLNPELGVGIDVLLKEDDVTAILIEAKKNLMYDGVDVKNIYFSDQAKLIIDGKYIK